MVEMYTSLSLLMPLTMYTSRATLTRLRFTQCRALGAHFA